MATAQMHRNIVGFSDLGLYTNGVDAEFGIPLKNRWKCPSCKKPIVDPLSSSLGIPNQVATEQQSLVLIKRLLAVSVSCITYLRGLFPEYAYGTRYLEDVCVKILREDKNCPGSTQLVKWMLGCYEALQKKYLRLVVLAIYTNIDDPQSITECYQFKFKYPSTGAVMSFSSNKGESMSACSDVKKASVMLIRKLYLLMQNLGPLPNDVCLTMKLFYYDEVTPRDYQPPGFKEGSCDSMMFDGDPIYLNVGDVTTPFHGLKLRVTTESHRMENIDKNILQDEERTNPKHLLCMDMDVAKPEAVELKCDSQENDASLNVNELSLTCHKNEGSERKTSDQSNKQRAQKDQKRQTDAGPGPSRRLTRSRQSLSDTNQYLDLSSSQEEPTTKKRRKFSEPKEPL